MSNSVLDWSEIWDEFDDWITDAEDHGKCKSCGQQDFTLIDWDKQQSKIEEIVERKLKTIAEIYAEN